MLPRTLSYADRFKIARDTGFEQMECNTAPDQKEAEEISRPPSPRACASTPS